MISKNTIFIIGMLQLLLLPIFSSAQSPGGIQDPVIWEKTWVSNGQSEFVNSKFNYHPYKYFSEGRIYEEYELEELNRFSMFVVFNTENSTEIGKLNTGDHDVIWSEDMLISTKEVPLKKYTKPQMLTYIEAFPNRADNDVVSKFTIGSGNKKDQTYKGGISELIIYDRLIGKKNKNRIESYLSIKYGLSLPISSNYYNSAGETIRESMNHGSFRHRVTMIGRDDGSGLYQKQSHNLYDDSKLTFALEELAKTNELNRGKLDNQSFLMWADNNTELKFYNDGTRSQLLRKWELKGKGEDINKKTFDVRINVSSFRGFDKSKNSYILISSDKTFTNPSEYQYFQMNLSEKNVYTSLIKIDNVGSDKIYLTFIQTDFFKQVAGEDDNIFPNPVLQGEYFNISVDNIQDDNLEIQILDVQGKVIRSRYIPVTGNLNVKERIIWPGQYIITVKGERTDLSYKLIVQ